MPLLGRTTDHLLHPVGDLLRKSKYILSKRAAAARIDRRIDDGPVITPWAAVDRPGAEHCARAERQRGGAGRHRRPLSEEVHLDAVLLDISVTQQADQSPVAQCRQQRSPRVLVERHDGDPHGRPLRYEVVEQRWRLDPLSHGCHGDALGAQVGGCVLPTPDMRERHDDTFARSHPLPHVFDSVEDYPLLDFLGRDAREPCTLDPVPGVGPKRTTNPSVEHFGVINCRTQDPPQVGRHHLPLVVPDPVEDIASHVPQTDRHGLRERGDAPTESCIRPEDGLPLVHRSSVPVGARALPLSHGGGRFADGRQHEPGEPAKSDRTGSRARLDDEPASEMQMWTKSDQSNGPDRVL